MFTRDPLKSKGNSMQLYNYSDSIWHHDVLLSINIIVYTCSREK